MATFSLGFAELLLAGRMKQAGCAETWTFEISLPVLPARRSFLIAAGLEQAVAMLEKLGESGPDLAGLDAARMPAPLDATVLKSVASLRFTGHVEAMPEGTVVFAGEPVVRLRAPAPEAVLVGAALVGILRSQTAVATKAARLVLAANGKPVYEVGVRSAARDAALLAARSASVGGASATSNAAASLEFGLPTLPVLPLSLVTALGGTVTGLELCGVMLDGALANEGEAALAALSDTPRAVVLDAATKGLAERVKSLRAGIQSLGWKATKLLVGGRVDEDVVDALEGAGVAVDGYCVGGELVVAPDSPFIAFDYELVEREIDGQKIPLARRDGGLGRRSVWRRRESGRFKSDTVQPETKPPPSGGVPLLVRVMEKGRRLFRAPSLSELRVLCNSQLSMLDPAILRRKDPATYEVSIVVEPRKAAEPPKKAPEPKSAPKAAAKSPPKGEAPRADEARRRAFSAIDDSSDFSVVSGAFESVVAANLGSPSDEEGSGAANDEPVEAASDSEVVDEANAEEGHDDSVEASDDSGADEDSPSEETHDEATEEPAAADETSVDDAAEEPVEPSDDAASSEASEEPEAAAYESSEPVEEHESSEHDAAEDHDHDEESVEAHAPEAESHADDEVVSDAEPDESGSDDEAADEPQEPQPEPEEEAPKHAAPKRGASSHKPAPAAKTPPPKPVAANGAASKGAPPKAAPAKAATPPKPVAPKQPEPARKPVAVAKSVAPTAVAAVSQATASVEPEPEPETTEPPLPSFGAEPFSSNGGAEPVATNSNPLLAAAARLRSMQRGEPLPARSSAPVGLESAPPAAAPAAASNGELPANPLLAAAARLKSLRGS